jgi:hypothetical protein
MKNVTVTHFHASAAICSLSLNKAKLAEEITTSIEPTLWITAPIMGLK